MLDNNSLQGDLAKLVLENPRQARRLLQSKIDTDLQAVESLLSTLSGPQNTRLRHLVANVARTHDRKELFVRHLLDWRDKETDEFTRRAIAAALTDVDIRALGFLPATAQTPYLRFQETYSYVADRLKHRLRNTMLGAQAQLFQLKTLLGTASNGTTTTREVESVMAKLNDAIIVMGRELEAIDVDPGHFAIRPINVSAWIETMNEQYGARFTFIRLDISGDTTVSIQGSDYLLTTIFWNIWTDAQQQVGEDCKIAINIRRTANDVEISIADNGEGFPESMLGVAFEQRFSTKSTHRGRGLLEVQDAVSRLEGNIELYEPRPGERRIKIKLPVFRES